MNDFAKKTLDNVEKSPELGFKIHNYNQMDPFLIHIPSNCDHWIYIGSNGATSAGREHPSNSLFPYYTQDKLFDMANASGSLCRIRYSEDNNIILWEPFSNEVPQKVNIERNLIKSISGTSLTFEEINYHLGITVKCTWSTSDDYGILHSIEIENTSEKAFEGDILFGLHNIMPAALTNQFQNEFSNLADAYKRCELAEPNKLALYYLNSIPTDRAEPSEGLRCTTVWSCGWEDAKVLINSKQLNKFREGKELHEITESRGLRGAYLLNKHLKLEAGARTECWIAADLNQSASAVIALQENLKTIADPVALLKRETESTSQKLREIIATADGIQESNDSSRDARHFSNALYNVLRGGIFAKGYTIPVKDFAKTVQVFNKKVYEKHKEYLESLPETSTIESVLEYAGKTKDNSFIRLCREYLPLIFSRRHGDPSRPWNRFNIVLKNEDGSPKYAYEGNWRDIFQNWEALLYSFPEFIESVIYKFVNNSTADGHNPYRITKDGFDWETFDPSSPWSNIGYWGDHQIIYLLKLLEASNKHHPSRLQNLLRQKYFSYAQVPYRIKSFNETLKNPSASILYSDEDEKAIYSRMEGLGEDGKMLPATNGDVYQVTLMEKLLVPLLAKLSNLVPGAGIWMNTQRPEWNDANNALAGYGVSVVTLGYIHRYILFMEELLSQSSESDNFACSSSVHTWIKEQCTTLEKLATDTEAHTMPQKRLAYLRDLGETATDYRNGIYKNGFSGNFDTISTAELQNYLKAARKSVADALRTNCRDDGLFHAYNTINPTTEGIQIHHLDTMLEGQVSILSSKLLKTSKVIELLKALRNSPLYCEDRASYLLQPDKDLPTFLEKNRVSSEEAMNNPLLKKMLENGFKRIVEKDLQGQIRFNGNFRNSEEVETALDTLKESPYAPLIAQEKENVKRIFEDTFQHRTFTGRSSAFFAFEGLGSIYWHMVSKLILAIQENVIASESEEDSHILKTIYKETFEGLGLHKSPHKYGAFPTDPYSHTPKHTGAQQPGMTGQVKEDLLSRFGELGVKIANGTIIFEPQLIEKKELKPEAHSFSYYSLKKEWEFIELPANSLAFTYCQVPIAYSCGKESQLQIHFNNGESIERETTVLNKEESESIFHRKDEIQAIYVQFPSTTFI
jgi:hypothetical protein